MNAMEHKDAANVVQQFKHNVGIMKNITLRIIGMDSKEKFSVNG